jgi:carbon storage regulator CsrA
MLILTRNLGERVFIDGNLISISVERIQGKQVRIGIEAPKGISIHREEVYDRIRLELSAQRKKTAQSSLPSSKKSSRGHILLVEDTPILQEVHRTFLEKLGYTVDIADTGKKALKMSQNHYDLILMDLGLPDTSGIEVIKAIRRRRKLGNVPILVLTAFDVATMKQPAMESGANGFETKPLSMQKLDQAMQDILTMC